MTPVFADAAYYVALLSPRDQHHEDAVRTSATLRRPIVVTEYVLIEVSNALAAVESRERAMALWDSPISGVNVRELSPIAYAAIMTH